MLKDVPDHMRERVIDAFGYYWFGSYYDEMKKQDKEEEEEDGES